MKSTLKFFDFNSKNESNCGDVLDIELSNRNLNWDGIILEKGMSPYFYPNNIFTPYFYFALATESNLRWKAKLNGEMQQLKTIPGDIWINPPGSPFSHEINEPCFFIILAVEEKVFLSAVNFPVNNNRIKFINNYNVKDDCLKNIIELFYWEVKTDGKNGNQYLQNLLSLLTNYYINNYSNLIDLQDKTLNFSKICEKDIESINRYILDNLDQNISINELASTLNYSKYYFLREFKKYTGLTPYQYIIEIKMRKAKEKLVNPKNSIASAAYDLGYNDQSHFSNIFKSHFGVTPGQFQKHFNSTN